MMVKQYLFKDANLYVMNNQCAHFDYFHSSGWSLNKVTIASSDRSAHLPISPSVPMLFTESTQLISPMTFGNSDPEPIPGG